MKHEPENYPALEFFTILTVYIGVQSGFRKAHSIDKKAKRYFAPLVIQQLIKADQKVKSKFGGTSDSKSKWKHIIENLTTILLSNEVQLKELFNLKTIFSSSSSAEENFGIIITDPTDNW